jgi:hypothetical protein
MAQRKQYRTHKPSGQVAPPLILLEGGEKAGKSFTAAKFSGSDRIGKTYWIEFGEVTAEEYGAVPGADYEIVEHDGSFGDLYGAIGWVHGIATEAKAAGERPVMLVVDSMSAEWELLRGWAANRAKGSRSNRAKLAKDPNAEVTISGNLWNDANDRHAMIMKLLRTFPGIVVMIAQGKVIAAIGENGQPVEGRKDYRVEGQKMLGFQSSCWVRVSRDEPALLIGCRKVNGGIRPGVEPAKQLPDDWTLDWLIFDYLQYDHQKAKANNLVEPNPERTPEQIRDEAVDKESSYTRLGQLYQEARSLNYDGVVVSNEQEQDELLLQLITRRGNARKPATDEQRQRLAQSWDDAGDFGDVESRLRYASEVTGREVLDLGSLTGQETHWVLNKLTAYIQQNTPPASVAPNAGEAA